MYKYFFLYRLLVLGRCTTELILQQAGAFELGHGTADVQEKGLLGLLTFMITIWFQKMHGAVDEGMSHKGARPLVTHTFIDGPCITPRSAVIL